MAALSTSNTKTTPTGNGLRWYTGQFTSTVGDASATLTIPLNKIYSGCVYANASGAFVACPWSFAAGSVANTVTVTIDSFTTVADGYFGFFGA